MVQQPQRDRSLLGDRASKLAAAVAVAFCLVILLFIHTAAFARAVPKAGPESNGAAQSRFLPNGVAEKGWPFVRGANFDGHSNEINLAESWPKSGPPVLWSRKLGQGYSGFVAKGERVYTQYQDVGGQYVVCLDATTGETLWQFRYGFPFEMNGLYPGPRSTPTLVGDNIYFAAPNGMVGCLNAKGKLMWSKNPKEEFKGRGTDFGYACSPTVVDGKAILPIGGKGAAMVALDAKTGELIWKTGDDSSSYTPALPISVDGKRQVVGYLENVIVGLDLESGKPLWRVELSPSGYSEHAAWPIYQEPNLWFSGPFNAGSRLLRLGTALNAGPSSLAIEAHVQRCGFERTCRRTSLWL